MLSHSHLSLCKHLDSEEHLDRFLYGLQNTCHPLRSFNEGKKKPKEAILMIQLITISHDKHKDELSD